MSLQNNNRGVISLLLLCCYQESKSGTEIIELIAIARHSELLIEKINMQNTFPGINSFRCQLFSC